VALVQSLETQILLRLLRLHHRQRRQDLLYRYFRCW
jgi:hypothetical protein